MLIGLHGPAGCGKDTSYSLIHELADTAEINVLRDAFADRLKLSMARLFYPQITLDDAVAWCNGLKGEFEEIQRVGWVQPIGRPEIGLTIVLPNERMTGREFMQRYGTEAHRDVFGEDFWVKIVLPDPHDLVYGRTDMTEGDLLVITDVRFPDEAEHVRACGGEIWEIVRPQVLKGDAHRSEQRLPDHLIDRQIDNSGDLDDLYSELSLALSLSFGL